jgi:hypothetical protein
MHLMAAGFSTMYLNERLVFGLAPPDIAGVFSQRLRWAMGALQILLRRNPLAAPGLTLAQSLLFFESCAYHFLAASTVLTSLAPVPFLFLGASPLQCDSLWVSRSAGRRAAAARALGRRLTRGVEWPVAHFQPTDYGLQCLIRTSSHPACWPTGGPARLAAFSPVLISHHRQRSDVGAL